PLLSRTETQAWPPEWRREEGGAPLLSRGTGATSGSECRRFCITPGLLPRQRTPMGTLNSRSGRDFRSERGIGFEPTTYSLGSCHSTTELRPQYCDLSSPDRR